MAITRNKLIPVLGIGGIAIIGTIAWMQIGGSAADRVRAGAPLARAPSALPDAKGADQDTPTETLRTVVTSNAALREDVQRVLKENEELRKKMDKEGRRGNGANAASPATGESAATSPTPPEARGAMDVFGDAIDRASQVAGSVAGSLPDGAPFARPRTPPLERSAARNSANAGDALGAPAEAPPDGSVQYKVKPPMGYSLHTTEQRGRNAGPPITTIVRTSNPGGAALGEDGQPGPAGRAAQGAQAVRSAGGKPEIERFFTIPENSTLAGVSAMTSIIGRVPIDGKVTDPMQWKAVVGRDNLAASGFELPEDLAGMIVSGIAIGDMALSCSEGKVRSLTFIFNDGAIRTVSARRGSFAENRIGSGGGGAAGNDDLGYISDLHGNPCIAGKFVTNAPAYLTDIVGVKTLEVAGQAYAEAQRTVSNSPFGGTTSAVTGSVGDYALGQAVSGAADEVSKWLMSRLKNSFDAVVTPSGERLVIHLDQEIRIDKSSNARKVVHRTQPQSQQLARGAHHGLE